MGPHVFLSHLSHLHWHFRLRPPNLLLCRLLGSEALQARGLSNGGHGISQRILIFLWQRNKENIEKPWKSYKHHRTPLVYLSVWGCATLKSMMKYDDESRDVFFITLSGWSASGKHRVSQNHPSISGDSHGHV